jgi:glycyl-tRNA synthetase
MVLMSNIENIQSLAKRRGFFWPCADIYPVTSGLWNYGPLGATLKRNIIAEWRKQIVEKDNMLEIDGTQIMNEHVFKASGHLSSFQDPLVECSKCKLLFRADKLIEKTTKTLVPEASPLKEFDALLKKHKIVCEKCKTPLTKTRFFNLMIASPLGPNKDPAYLRPETCQSIFVDFPAVHRTMRMKLPQGIAQVGKAFRNEISPRQSILRSREFTQAEAEIFFNPETPFEKKIKTKLPLMLENSEKINLITCESAIKKKILSSKIEAYYLGLVVEYLLKLGIPIKNIRLREVGSKERAFYAKACWDLEVNTSVGWVEVAANNHRSDYDLTVHSKGSKKDLSVVDGDKKVLPNIWEISIGIDRILYCLMDIFYCEDKVGGDERTVLKLPPQVSPYKVAIFPLVKKDGLKEKAEELFSDLKQCFPCFLDISGSIGKRYRRQDEIGTPFCLTIDFDTMKDNTVTLRDRDSTKQKRVAIKDLKNLIWEKIMK